VVFRRRPLLPAERRYAHATWHSCPRTEVGRDERPRIIADVGGAGLTGHPTRNIPPSGVPNRLERLGEIGHEIVGMLDADRDPDRRVGDPETVAGFLRDARMGRRGGMAG
jgi:hypothetical protein